MENETVNNVFVFSGDILSSNMESLKIEIKKFISDNKLQTIVFDLSNTNVVDSMGIGLLIATYNSINKDGGTVTIRSASNNIKELFKMLRIDKYLIIE